MAVTIEEALALPGEQVAVWDEACHGEEWLGVYSTGEEGTNLLACERVPAVLRSAVTDDLRRRGVRVGSTYRISGWVWVADERGFALWSDERRQVEGSGSVLLMPDGAVRAEEVSAVVSFVAEGDLGHRGVRLDLRDGSQRSVAEEHDPAAGLDPTYNRDTLLIDGSWAFYLARDLAGWLSVSHQDELS